MARFTLLIATNNGHKVAEFRRLLAGADANLVTPNEAGVALEVPETGATFAENARIKARAFRDASGLPSLADDSGVAVDALGGRPGVRSARYGGEGLDDAGRVRLLLSEMAGVPDDERACRFHAVLAFAAPDGREETAEGVCEGRLAREPSGLNGFGYDPVFYLPQFGRTMAELAPEEKDAASHRGQAARRMLPLLRAGEPAQAAR